MPPFDALPGRTRTASPTRPVKLSGETFAALINLSGRRRFTSQRLVLYAVLAVRSGPDALTTSRDALRLFSEAHDILVNGNDSVPGVFCDALDAVYFGSENGDARIREFIVLAQRALDAIEQGLPGGPALVEQLVDMATPLLALLNRITQVYEELSKQHAMRVRKQLVGIMSDIESIAKQARMVAFNAQIVAARAGNAGKEFSVVAGVLSDITGEIDTLVKEAMNDSV
ncbi:methyl-accepting chemotaxis protein [Noviherbaspirillum denitrificans]|uniref:Chemotaxis protein n=1 Tax=Noviherbaspirillum denitrificans TaxID=1968433 RepID=A0A254TKX5_9BURK|nr:methyl-accepting chemotaxis protein [Noviherbaspirillum denitrificans]OWW21972.1 chemotaxis protein [Noviherbaspirillum denitrificans]